MENASTKASMTLATYLIKNPGRALEIWAKKCSAAASRKGKAALSFIIDVNDFCQTLIGVCLGKVFLKNNYNDFLTDT